MRQQILAGAAVLALAAGMTTSAMASNYKAGRSDSHIGRVHAGAMHNFRGTRDSRLAGANPRRDGWEAGNPYRAGYRNLGPLGFTLGCGLGNCQGYSVSAWSY